MKVQGINNYQQNFTGKVYVAGNLNIRDIEKLRMGSSKIDGFAENINCDFTIFKKGMQKGLSVFAKNINTKKECTKEVIGYPSGSTMKDIDLIIGTMKEANDSFIKSQVSLGWSCE